ncbi:juvenile hormone acid O-methyltransferase-like [Phlebotomus argentipes]|uniref:juvenile hormone acid O-methyltransferase-like n=1 Tax=Phlebotomus argentipes TaxID=94469 RepID=UPI002892EA0D|nr:juvenile hormone acid O-methyltransferase-like [Phlebotomus argentipes]
MSQFNGDLLWEFNRINYACFEKFFGKYGQFIQWKSNEFILDIGCGSGDLTHKYIYPLLPKDFQQFLITDINRDMIEVAKRFFVEEQKVSCDILDISSELPNELTNKFNHIFCLNCLMWVKNQRKAFENIYNLLSADGQFFLYFVTKHALMDTQMELCARQKWRKFIKNPEDFYPFPYRSDQNAVETIKEMMKSIGFTDFNIHSEVSTFAFCDESEFLGFFKALPNPLHSMTPSEQEDYLKEAVDLATAKNLIHESGESKESGTHFVVYGRK